MTTEVLSCEDIEVVPDEPRTMVGFLPTAGVGFRPPARPPRRNAVQSFGPSRPCLSDRFPVTSGFDVGADCETVASSLARGERWEILSYSLALNLTGVWPIILLSAIEIPFSRQIAAVRIASWRTH